MGSGSAFPVVAGTTAMWMGSWRAVGRSGFSATCSAPQRAASAVSGSLHTDSLIESTNGSADAMFEHSTVPMAKTQTYLLREEVCCAQGFAVPESGTSPPSWERQNFAIESRPIKAAHT